MVLLTISCTIMLTFLSSCLSVIAGDQHSIAQVVQEIKYSRFHSLGEQYNFDPKDGWQQVNISSMQYKYRRDSQSTSNSPGIVGQPNKRSSVTSEISLSGTIKGVVKAIINGLKAIGSSEAVTITWYTGQDLLNPSCWEQSGWHPSDSSFACAITEDGWMSKPECFDFIELCNTPKKCVFVRVVDSCAGCAPGSKHVDLTKAAFAQLADLNEGILSVQLRKSTKPDHWYESLWGPQD